MAIKRRNKLIGQITLINTESQEEVIQPITIIENIVEQSITNVVQNTTIIQMAVEENPAISAALVKLETIEAGAQVNPDLTPLSEAIDTHRVNFNNPHQTTKEQAGVNFITGTINMVNNKKAIINFNMAFTKTPRISLTL